MEHGSQIGTSFSAIEKTLFCMPFVPEIEERGKKKKPNPKPFLSVYSYSCISCLQQMVLSHWFLLFSLRVDLSYLSITAFKFD